MSRFMRAMRLALGLISYATAAVAIVGAAFLLIPDVAKGTVPTETKAQISPRIQAWQDRIAEERLYTEKAKAADLAEKERVAALYRRNPAPPAPAVTARQREVETQESADRERASRAKERARREAKRRSRQPEVQQALGYAPEPRVSDPFAFLTRRDRYGY